MSVPTLSHSPIPSVSGPTRLRLPDLLHATDRAAADVLDGLLSDAGARREGLVPLRHGGGARFIG